MPIILEIVTSIEFFLLEITGSLSIKFEIRGDRSIPEAVYKSVN